MDPYRKGDIEDLEKVQKRATRLLPELKGFKYYDRLKACKLPTLHYRRLRGDMIETFKIVSGKYDSYAAPILTGLHSSVTRGHDLRLEKFRARYDLRKYFFLQIEWLIIGTPCRVVLYMYMLIQLILLRVISITSGIVRMYYMIIMLKFMEPEAEVKLVQNFYYKIYLVCN